MINDLLEGKESNYTGISFCGLRAALPTGLE